MLAGTATAACAPLGLACSTRAGALLRAQQKVQNTQVAQTAIMMTLWAQQSNHMLDGCITAQPANTPLAPLTLPSLAGSFGAPDLSCMLWVESPCMQ